MEPGDKLVTIYRAMGQPEAEIIKGRRRLKASSPYLNMKAWEVYTG
jgi:hypothetical protein